MRRNRDHRWLGLALALAASLAGARASADVVVTVGQMVVAFDPNYGWSMVESSFEGEPVTAIPRGGSNGTAIHSSSGWAGELHGNLVLDSVAVAIDDSPIAIVPQDGDVLAAQERFRVERRAFLGGVAKVISTIVVSSSSIVDQVTLQGISPQVEMDLVYSHMATRANGMTQTTAYDASGTPTLSLNLNLNDGKATYLPAGTQALEQSNSATGLHVRTSWSQPSDDVFVIDRPTDQKVYHRSRDLERVLGRLWSGTQTVHVWRQ